MIAECKKLHIWFGVGFGFFLFFPPSWGWDFQKFLESSGVQLQLLLKLLVANDLIFKIAENARDFNF